MIALAAEDELTLVAARQRNHQHAGSLQDFAAQVARQDLVGRGFGGKCGDLRLRHPALQPLDAKIGDRRQEDQHFAQHDEDDGQRQYLAGKPPEEARCNGPRCIV